MQKLTEQQEAELFTSISGKGEVPLKFNYITKEGAEYWVETVESERNPKKGHIASFEYGLLQDNSEFLLRNLTQNGKNVNVLDLGCGDGLPCVPILEKAAELSLNVRYVPVDISQELLDVASKNIKKRFPNIKIKKVLLDFDQGSFAQTTSELRRDNFVNMLCFLGSTLGNFSNTDRILSNFRDSMTASDYLIIGIQLANLLKMEKTIEFYKTEPVRRLTFALLKSYGVTRESGTFDTTFNKELSQIEERFILNRNIKLKIGPESVNLEKGESLLLFRSRKFTQWNLQKIISDVGYRLDTVKTGKDASYELIMCQPVRYLF